MKKLLTILVLTISVNSWAATYYVDPSSSGTNSGTFANPWKSLSAINQSVLAPGDFVLFKRGEKFTGTLTITKSGTSGNPITFGAYGTGADPLFWGTGSTISQLFYLNNRSYINFYGLKISDTTISATDRSIQSRVQRGFVLDGSTNNIVIRKCTIDRVGVGAYFVGPNNWIDSCDIGNMRMVVNDNTNPDNDYGANPVVISSANNKVTNSYFHDCWATSFDYGYDGGAVEFYGDGSSNNYIAWNKFVDCLGVCENGSGSGGTISGNVFACNICINNGSMTYINNGGNFTVTVSNMQFYNNVFIETTASRSGDSYMISMRNSSSDAGIIVLKNNIFWLTNTMDVCRPSYFSGSQLTHENNIYRLGSGSVLNFTIGGSEKTTSNNLFTYQTGDPTTWYLKPTAVSEARQIGQSVSAYVSPYKDYEGKTIVNPPDAGAIQYSGVVSSVTIFGFKN